MYPTLPEALQRKWDEVEQLLYDELITKQVCVFYVIVVKNSFIGFTELPVWGTNSIIKGEL